jgi:trimethylamine--corrinoid protein Co-methyltransferase
MLFYAPILSDWRNFETWREGGRVAQRRQAGQCTLGSRSWPSSKPPRSNPAIDEALKEFVERRKREGGALAA